MDHPGVERDVYCVSEQSIGCQDQSSLEHYTDTNLTSTSTITIVGFGEVDNGGNIQCIDLKSGAIQGMANVQLLSLILGLYKTNLTFSSEERSGRYIIAKKNGNLDGDHTFGNSNGRNS